MDNGIFGRLSIEEHVESVAADYTVMDAISAEEAYVEAIEIANEAHIDAAAMDKATLAAERLETQVSNEEAILAQPESITAGTILLSQESLATTAMLLGADAAMIADYQVSNEAALDNPVSAMQVSHEGAKDFLKKLYEGIKLLFKKIGNAMKKLYTKLVVVMDGTAKSAKALAKTIKDSKIAKPATETFSEGKSRSLNKKFAGKGPVIAGMEALISSNGSDGILKAMDVISGLRSIAMAASEKSAKTGYGSLKALAEKNSAASALEKATDYIKPDGIVGVTPVVVRSNSVQFVEIVVADTSGDDDDDYVKALRDIKFSVKTLSLKPEDEDAKVKVLDKGALQTLCGKVETSAKGLKSFASAREKDIKTLEKELATLAKDSDGSAFVNRMKGNVMNASRAMGASVLMSSTLAYAANNKAVLGFVKDNFAEYKSNDL